ELAPARDLGGIEHGDGAAALTLHRGLLGLPSPRGLGNGPQGRGQIVFDNRGLAVERGEFSGRLGAAVRTDQRVFARVPLRLSPAGRAGELLAGGDNRLVRAAGRIAGPTLVAHGWRPPATGGTPSTPHG